MLIRALSLLRAGASRVLVLLAALGVLAAASLAGGIGAEPEVEAESAALIPPAPAAKVVSGVASCAAEAEGSGAACAAPPSPGAAPASAGDHVPREAAPQQQQQQQTPRAPASPAPASPSPPAAPPASLESATPPPPPPEAVALLRTTAEALVDATLLKRWGRAAELAGQGADAAFAMARRGWACVGDPAGLVPCQDL